MCARQKRDPETAKALIDMGTIFLASDELQLAIDFCSRAISCDPTSPDGYNLRGLARLRAGDWEGAIADYDRVIAIDPEWFTAYMNRARVRACVGDLDGAIADWDWVIARSPDLSVAYHFRGCTYIAQGHLSAGITDLDCAIALCKDELPELKSKAYYDKARALALASRPSEACMSLEHAIQLDDKLLERARTDTDFDSIRSAERFNALVCRI